MAPDSKRDERKFKHRGKRSARLAFFAKLGFSYNPMFTDETAACMLVGEHAFVMLLRRSEPVDRRATSPFGSVRIASIAKSFVATAVLEQIHGGRLSLDRACVLAFLRTRAHLEGYLRPGSCLVGAIRGAREARIRVR